MFYDGEKKKKRGKEDVRYNRVSCAQHCSRHQQHPHLSSATTTTMALPTMVQDWHHWRRVPPSHLISFRCCRATTSADRATTTVCRRLLQICPCVLNLGRFRMALVVTIPAWAVPVNQPLERVADRHDCILVCGVRGPDSNPVHFRPATLHITKRIAATKHQQLFVKGVEG